MPYSRDLRAHFGREPRQYTALSSKFLGACRAYNNGGDNSGKIGKQELVDKTVRLGFKNAVDGFLAASSRDALSGYQKARCFCCFRRIPEPWT